MIQNLYVKDDAKVDAKAVFLNFFSAMPHLITSKILVSATWCYIAARAKKIFGGNSVCPRLVKTKKKSSLSNCPIFSFLPQKTSESKSVTIWKLRPTNLYPICYRAFREIMV